MTLCNLSYEDRKLSFQTIHEDLKYCEFEVLNFMVKPHLHGWMVRNAGSLNINERLLCYVLVHMLSSQGTNFAQLTHEDIFFLWWLKNNIVTNWPHHIMQHMVKCKNNNTSLPYIMLITRILVLFEVDLSYKCLIGLGRNHYFVIKTLSKLNIVNVNNVWHIEG